mgnify:CR=1 FL=1
MTTLNLEPERTDDGGRTWYHPVVRRVKQRSKYKDNQFELEGVPGYWNWNKEPNLIVGQAYEFTLTTKENPGYKDYQDIRKAEPTTEAAPVYENTPGVAAYEQTRRPVRPDGEEVFRTKEELRWTEAMHMAVQLHGPGERNAEAPHTDRDDLFGIAILRYAEFLYDLLSRPPESSQEPRTAPEEDEDDLFGPEEQTPARTRLKLCKEHNTPWDVEGRHPLFGDGPNKPATGWCEQP